MSQSLLAVYNQYSHILNPLLVSACSLGALRLLYNVGTSNGFPRWQLCGKVVLITGASQGIGRALAHQLHKANTKLILAARSIDKLKELAAELQATNPTNPHTPECFYLDLAAPNGIAELLALSPSGQIDVLINNAGIATHDCARETTMNTHKQSMQVNYLGQVELTQALLPHMPSGGSVVVVSSVQGKFAIPNRSAYGASKHACGAYFDSLRAEEHPNTHVLVVCPGYVQTNLSLNALTGQGNTLSDSNDPHLKTGMSPEYVAQRVVHSLVHRENELILAPATPKVAFWLRVLFPDLYFRVMASRAQSEKKTD